MSTIWHNDSGARWSGVASVLGTWGYDATNIPANADLHALSNQHRNALHEVRRADEAGPDRTARSKLRSADLPVCALRLRRKLFEGALDRICDRQPSLAVQHRSPCRRQHRPLVSHFDQTEFGQSPQIFVADRRHFQAAGLNIPQRPAKTNSSFEAEFSEGIVCHSLRLVWHFDQILSARRLNFGRGRKCDDIQEIVVPSSDRARYPRAGRR